MKDHLATTWKHIRRSPYQALAAIGIMTLTFFISTLLFLSAVGSQKILQFFETRPQVTAFFKDEATEGQINELKSRLLATGKIKEIKYVSKEEALKIYQEQNKNDPLLLEMVTANILPASLEVSTTDISYLGEVAKILKESIFVEEVVYQEDIVKSLKNWTDNLRKIGIGMISFLSLVSFLVILVIIGMKVALRKKEVEILQLLGATKGYIYFPFILEGIFYGVLGGILGWGLAFLLLLYSTPFLKEFLEGISLLPVSVIFMLMVLGGELTLGVLIGCLGSWLAVRKYLK
ncbi:MAG: cell division protein FtsX [Microgenomates group bacterium]